MDASTAMCRFTLWCEMMKRRLACIGRTTNLFSRCKRNNVSTFHQYACLNMKHHACNKRGSSLVQPLHQNEKQSLEICCSDKERERGKETKRNVFIKFPATSYFFHAICSCPKLQMAAQKRVTSAQNKCTPLHAGLLVFPFLKCEHYLSLITTKPSGCLATHN